MIQFFFLLLKFYSYGNYRTIDSRARVPRYTMSPFFNVYENGNVCMGMVDFQIEKSVSVEEFITAWEQIFFNNYFSHLNDQNPQPTIGYQRIWGIA